MSDRVTSRAATVLALDASAGACSVAVVRDGEVRARLHRRLDRGHAAVLVPMIRDAMGEAGCGFADLDAVGVTIGPGSFTGVRVGLAAARGVALAVGRPCIGVTTLEALAAAAGTGGRLLVAIDTRRGDVDGQVFEASGAAAGAPFLANAASIAGRCDGPVQRGAGAGAGLVSAALAGPPEPLPIASVDAVFVARLAAGKLAAGRSSGESGRLPSPLYLRGAEVSVPAHGGSLRP